MRKLLPALTFMLSLVFTVTTAVARDVEGSGDHPLVERIAE